MTVRKWCLTHQFALQIASHAQNEFGGANLRTRIFFVSDCWIGNAPPRLSQSWQSVLNFRTILRGSPDQARNSSKFQAQNESPASAPSPSAFLYAAHFLCRIACLGMRRDSARNGNPFGVLESCDAPPPRASASTAAASVAGSEQCQRKKRRNDFHKTE